MFSVDGFITFRRGGWMRNSMFVMRFLSNVYDKVLGELRKILFNKYDKVVGIVNEVFIKKDW